ncbi:hypothetical protein H310_13531 [Aphanomyces invadans]|uniref:Calmodulin n=1 Tax=Aphanomyces invadans TaxID=157072 RepID=A0A024TCX2_9STRA|nr:hypothetical protein H310_13531 [Aphanomyces invadans]ETV92005.1 hypothetical protein H310_13531 [Aphanomyces invadans]|eukprot:XP_008879302.1 hypothetical protein H310_13531 [Aphanomyces invadans]
MVTDVFSAEEAELVAMQFSLAANRRNARDLDKLEATLLFKDHAPEFSPQEVKELFAGIEAKGSFQLNVNEYLEIKARKKIELETNDEEDLKRHFTVLDYHGNGSLVATEITEALEKTGDPGVNVLKEAIQNATTLSSDGTITFELFRQAIHDMNRKNQAAIAAGMMRMYRLKAKLQEQATKRRMSRGTASSIEVEYQVLVAQTERQQAELITVQNDLFSRVYGIIVAQYMCQTRVLHAFEAFFDHLHTEDSHLFRRNLEKNGRVVAVHPSFLLIPGPVIERSPAYTNLCNFMVPDMVYDSDNHGPIFTNRAYRKIFLWYCLQGSLTNFQTIGRTSFLRFARDCRVADLSDRPVLDADLDACYVMALREPRVASPKQRVVDSESFHFHFKPTPLLFEHASKHSACAPGGGMTFKQWVHGTTLLLCRCLNIEVTLGRRYTPFDHCGLVQEWPSTQKADELFREYILPHANQLQTQPLGPEVSQPQVMQFILKHVWPLKQIFSHFGGHSMTSIELNKGLPLRDFIHFVRCFDILPSGILDQPRPQVTFRQLSLQEIVQEYNAAKLDVGFSKTESRESLDLNFHEFLRCIQRLAMAMNRSAAVGTDPGDVITSTKHNSLVSSFQHFRSDLQSPGKAQVHLFQHSRQLHADDRKMSNVMALVRSKLTSQALLAPPPAAFPKPLQSQATDISLFDHLPPLAMENVSSPIKPSPASCPKTSRTSSIRSETPKCIVPKPTHLPLSMLESPRYSKARPFSLGGSPRIKTIRAPLPLESPQQPTTRHDASPQTTARSTTFTSAMYKGYTVPPLSSRGRPRTPYEDAAGVVSAGLH